MSIIVGMLQVHENDISLRRCSGGTPQLRTFEGTLRQADLGARFQPWAANDSRLVIPPALAAYFVKIRFLWH